MSRKITFDEIRDTPRPMTPDAHPLTEEDFARMKQTPRAAIIRRALRLTQEEFSERYRIPLETLREWEQGLSEPDRMARAYLLLIAKDPEYVSRLLDPVAKSA